MNEKVKNLIEKEIERLDVSKKQIRDNHLISLGLIDNSKTERKYQDHWNDSAKLDREKNKYYTEKNFALEITDEEYEEICKYFPQTKQENNKINNDIETIQYWVTFMGRALLALMIVQMINLIVSMIF